MPLSSDAMLKNDRLVMLKSDRLAMLKLPAQNDRLAMLDTLSALSRTSVSHPVSPSRPPERTFCDVPSLLRPTLRLPFLLLASFPPPLFTPCLRSLTPFLWTAWRST